MSTLSPGSFPHSISASGSYPSGSSAKVVEFEIVGPNDYEALLGAIECLDYYVKPGENQKQFNQCINVVMLSIAQWDSSTGAYRVHLCVLPKIFPNVSLKLLIVQVTVVKPTPQSACWTPRSKHYKVQCSAKRLCAVLSRV